VRLAVTTPKALRRPASYSRANKDGGGGRRCIYSLNVATVALVHKPYCQAQVAQHNAPHTRSRWLLQMLTLVHATTRCWGAPSNRQRAIGSIKHHLSSLSQHHSDTRSICCMGRARSIPPSCNRHNAEAQHAPQPMHTCTHASCRVMHTSSNG
jgi:hypothetical protein